MPELPEVETVLKGLQPLLLGRTVTGVVARASRLRWPLDARLARYLVGRHIERLSRRAKYLLVHFDAGVLLLHLGMSGVLRVVPSTTSPERHDHFDLQLDDGNCLRLNDPRRFGAVVWVEADVDSHPLLCDLGPEPLSAEFTADYLLRRAQARRLAIKSFLMDQKIVVGVGNIYASEALFRAGIDPSRAAGSLSRKDFPLLVEAIKAVLSEAIGQGGTTLRDFSDAHGRPGYFAQQLQVYGRKDLPCLVCGTPIRVRRIGGRSSFDCPHCQK